MTIRVRVPQKEGGGIVVLPKGTYELEIVSAEEGVNKNTNNAHIALELRVMSGAQQNQVFRDWVALTEASAWRLQALLSACDPDQEIHTNISTGDQDSEGNEINDVELPSVVDLVSRTFLADCRPKDNNKGITITDIVSMYPMEETSSGVQADASLAPEPKPASRAPQQRRAPARRPRAR